MCLAVPGEIRRIIGDGKAVVDFMGVEREVALDLLGSADVGDFVIVHAGFAIEKLNRNEAIKTIECFKELLSSAGPDQG
jgi:hydrogenase expression/formation protein HypC